MEYMKVLVTRPRVALLVSAVVSGCAMPAAAQQRDLEVSTLDEVIVTARRQPENARNTPIAVEVVQGARLGDDDIDDVQDLQRRVAGLQTSQVNRDDAFISIRGQGPGVGAFPGVVTYFNEAPFDGLGLGQMFDLESVQILKGPQGTLFGRNSNGGAILLTSQAPLDETSAVFRLVAGDHDRRSGEVSLNGASADGRWLVRVAGLADRRDGFTRVEGSDIALDDRDVSAARLSATWSPVTTVRNALVVDGSRLRTSGTSAILEGLNPAGPLALFPAQSGVAQAAFGFLARQRDLGPRTQVGTSVDPVRQVDNWGVVDRLDIRLSPDWSFTNIASWRRYKRLFRTDYDGTALPLLDYSVTPDGLESDRRQFTEEMQIRGRSGAISYTAGAFHYEAQSSDDQRQIGVLFFQPIVSINRPDDRSQALYADARWDASSWISGLALEAGYRQTWDRRRQSAATLNLATATCSGVGASLPDCLLQDEARFDAGNWRLSATWEATPELTAYATARRGYKSGGLNLGQPFADRRHYDPEYLTDFEVGLKGRAVIGSAPLRFAIDAYRGDYSDIQVNALVIDATAIYNIVENGAEATIQGVEAEGAVGVTQDLDVRFAFAFTDAGYDRYISSIYGDLTGAPWPYTSRHKGVVGLDWRAPSLGRLGSPVIAIDYAWQSGSTFGYDPDPATREGGYGVLDARFEIRELGGRPVDLAVFATNLTDETYRTGVIGLYNSAGLDSAVYGEPRMVGIRLTARFGAEAERGS